MTDLAGITLGQYELHEMIGHGGMADVYRADQTSMGRQVAIKVMPTHFLQDRMFLQRFMQEVKVIASLQHPHILPVYDFGEQDGMPYIVMALLTGGSLADRIHETGSLPLPDIVRLVQQIADGLEYAHHKGIIHRDFKPSNVLLDERGNAYLADFGIAKITESTAQLTGSGMVGTPAYMAPEMAQRGGVSTLVDVYALGVTLYQMLTGRYPYEADTPMGVLMAHMSQPIPDVREERPTLPDSVQMVIERAMAKDPMDRYQTPGELAEALTAAAAGEAIPAAPPRRTSSEDTFVEGRREPPVKTPEAATPPMQAEPAVRLSPTKAKRRGISGWVWVGMVIVGLIVVGVVLVTKGSFGGTATFIAQPTAQPTEELTLEAIADLPTQPILTDGDRARELAMAGVNTNDDWTPYFEVINEAEMALVPAGCFTIGEEGREAAGPAHRVCFEEPFWIDRFEVSTTKFVAFLNSRGNRIDGGVLWLDIEDRDNTIRDDGGSYSQYGFLGLRPVIEITWYGAHEYCIWKKGQLPHEAQWEYAARGPDNLQFPWGNEFVGNLAVTSADSLQPTGSIRDGASWVGALDMSGNAAEWVDDWYAEYSDTTLINPSGPEEGLLRVVRGSSWQDYGTPIHSSARYVIDPADSEKYIGFRCAMSYQP